MRIFSFAGRFALVAAAAILVVANTAWAQVIIAHDPVIGSSNTVSADPRIPRPNAAHCTVDLFDNLEFADYSAKSFTYTPPADCPGPYSKVIFAADFTVTEGVQYDRTVQFFLGGANILFGTTAEPGSTLSPYWHVENDITDLSALLKSPQTGSAILYNIVNSTYTGIIYSSAHLVFYPASYGYPAPAVPDVVIGLPGNSGAANLSTTTSLLMQSVSLPTNVEAAYLDVIAQSQSSDEFWYTCVPNTLTQELESCGNTAFRETEITIDGVPAGVAPIYPWIYTGGIDPYLWFPIPGVQTLNFKPFRVDLSPFAGVLSNGKAHTVALSVFNADSWFSVTGNLLVYTDKGSAQVTGSVVYNDLAAEPTPTVINKITTDSSGNVGGYVTVASNRAYTIEGKNHTSHGDVTSRVDAVLNFNNTQHFTIGGPVYDQNITQSTQGGFSTTTTTADGKKRVDGQLIDYPFSFDIDLVYNSDGSGVQTSTSDQKFYTAVKPFEPSQQAEQIVSDRDGVPIPYVYGIGDEVASHDALAFSNQGYITGNTGTKSSQVYVQADTTGACYNEALTSLNNALTGVKTGSQCAEIQPLIKLLLEQTK